MFVTLAYLVVTFYCLTIGIVTLYGLSQMFFLWYYRKYHRRMTPEVRRTDLDSFPVVTIQLPVFNERYVVSRLIDAVCNLDYPRDKLQIHVLDDSTDDTRQIIEDKVAEWIKHGVDIDILHRESREGYKAGALQHALQHARGEFIALFDADFVPKADFLIQTIPWFTSANTGAVQTRWEHINEDFSLLTQMQAFQLNMHFTIEQSGRHAAQVPLQFNGTAGIWRKSAIIDADGWHCDTLTEDLDLSYRAQLRGWKILFLEHIGSPAELPIEMPGLKSQQFRWMKGGAETARKMLPRVWKSQLSLYEKLLASQHLLAGMIFIWVFLSGLFSVPLLWAIRYLDLDIRGFIVFLLGLLSLGIVSFIANARTSWAGISVLAKLRRWLLQLPVFLTLSMGMAFHNSVAIVQGLFGKRSPFIRTPKYAIGPHTAVADCVQYSSRKIPPTTVFEILLALYFLSGVVMAGIMHETAFVAYHIALAMGYAVIGGYSIRHPRMSRL